MEPTPPPPTPARTPSWLPASARFPAPSPGTRLLAGRYQVLAELGRGGMGVVYRAVDVALQRPVAVKVLVGARGADRLVTEARAAARLRHPGIVTVHDVGEEAGAPFLVMDLVEGQTLEDLLRGPRLPVRRAAELGYEVALALAHAHAEGVVHRDVKPGNVLVTREGRPLLVDFGLARELEGPGAGTQVDALLGTPGWAAPEQMVQRGAVGPAADVYGLGAVLYTALTGQPPVTDEGLAAIVATLHEPPTPPRALNPQVHADLETIVLTCLAKAPAARYPTAAALAEDLRRYLAGEPILARPPGPLRALAAWARRRRAAAAAVVTLAATLVAVTAERG